MGRLRYERSLGLPRKGRNHAQGRTHHDQPTHAPTTPDATGGAPGGRGVPGVNLQQIQQCLTRHGVKLNGGSLPNFSDPKIANALRACTSQLPGTESGSPANPLQQ